MRVRLATFNLESLDDRPGHGPPLDLRIRTLRPQLERLEADILCLQEVNGQASAGGEPRSLAALEAVLAGTAYARFHRAHTTNRAGHLADVHNLVTLSRWPILETLQLWNDLVPALSYAPVSGLGDDEPPTIPWDRPMLHTVVAAGGVSLHVLNLHLRAPLAAPVAGQKVSAFKWQSSRGWAEGFFIASLKRSGQALEARLAVDQILDRDGEALVAVIGDFNAEPRETPLRLLAADPEDSGNAGLVRRALRSLAADASNPYTLIHDGRRLLVDHILVSPALARAHRRTIIDNGTLADEVRQAEAHAMEGCSFHAPIVAELSLGED